MNNKSKQYFTKYLPVQGEIKEGDKFIAEGQLLTCYEMIKWGDVPRTKVKLFLCSRDIQVGDKIRHLGTFEERIVEDIIDYSFKVSGGSSYISSNQWCKEIGQVSPYATWVKEYDIINEEDTGFYWGAGEEGLGYFLIKGPCGHFH